MWNKNRLTILTFAAVFVLGSTLHAADSSLVGWWRLDDGSGGTAVNSGSKGSSWDGVLYGTPIWVSGAPLDGALDFNGVHHLDHVWMPQFNLSPSGVTLSAWMNANSFPQWVYQGPIVSYVAFDSTKGANGFGLECGEPNTQTGLARIEFVFGANTSWPSATTGYILSKNTWYHVAGTYDGITIKMYVDGNLMARLNNTQGIMATSQIGNIGRNPLLTLYFDGMIDDARLYTRALSQNEVMGLYLNTRPDVAKAWEPSPYIDDNTVPIITGLSWMPGKYATQHNVYFGTDFNDVNNATNPNVLPGRGTQSGTTYTLPTLQLNTSYYWRIDEVNDPCLWKGWVWSFTTIGSKTASNPYPADGAVAVPLKPMLSWRPGDWVASSKGHNLYLGTDFNEVNLATPSSHPDVNYVNLDVNSYTLGNSLNFGAQYYWRVDEVNDPCVWTGPVWSFTVENYIDVDEFQYNSDDDLYTRWPDPQAYPYYPQCSLYTGQGAVIHSVNNIYGMSGSLEFMYNNDGSTGSSEYYSEARTEFSGGTDWTAGRALSLLFHGNPSNGNDPVYDRMYVGLEDTAGHYAEVNNPDPNAQLAVNWQNWNIDLSQFSNAEVNLSSVRYLSIGFGVRCNDIHPGDTGTVFFNSIRIYPSRCVPEYGPLGDITGDCSVDWQDIAAMANEWLHTDVVVMAQTPKDPNYWWKFDDGSGYRPVNSGTSGSDWDGLIYGSPLWVSGPNGFGGALDFSADNGDHVYVPPLYLNDVNAVSVTAWIKARTWAQFIYQGVVAANINVDPTGSSSGFSLETGNNGSIEFAFGTGTGWANAGTGQIMFTNTWTHVAGTYNAGTVKVYVNGVLQAQGVAPAILNSNSYVNIARNPLLDTYFDGVIDDVRIYTYALSQAEIVSIMGQSSLVLPEDPQFAAANLHVDGPGLNIINFKDLAILANDWRKGPVLWP